MAGDHSALYEPGEAAGVRASVLVHHLTGAMDAGGAGRLALTQLIESLPSRRVATFDSDALIDYRSRRPFVTLNDWVYDEVREPAIALDVLEDYDGAQILVLHGPEPDMRWQQFAASVSDLARAAGVETTAGLMGMPATIPHTRPTFVHRTATDPGFLPKQTPQPSLQTMMASMDMYLQSQLGRSGLRAIGLIVGVPYYLSDTEYPASSVALLEHLANYTGLALPVGDLEAHATHLKRLVSETVEESEEMREVVGALEERYDEEWGSGDGPRVGAAPMVSGEVIAHSFEQFLKRVDEHRDAEARPGMIAETAREGGARRGRHAAAPGAPRAAVRRSGRARHRRPDDQ